MSCPTCGHKLSTIIEDGQQYIFHCNRCGTLKTMLDDGSDQTLCVPKLVERCRAFYHDAKGLNIMAMRWHRKWVSLGISEFINLPQDRPTETT